MTIYDRIRQLRTSKGLSQGQLAHMVGYEGRSAISKVENGERDISQSMIEKYADALGVSPSYLLFGDDDDNQPIELSREERFLIERFRNIPTNKKGVAIEMINALANN